MIHVERALFVVGDPNSGKSVQLRSMFRDLRFASQGKIPTARNLPNSCALSNERWLYLRLTSPHEAVESLNEFFDKCDYEMQLDLQGARRWSFACALQPTAANKMPDVVTTVSKFIARFEPERTRVVLFHPDKDGNLLEHQNQLNLLTRLQALPRTEVMMADARTKTGNGLIYADFFDFT